MKAILAEMMERTPGSLGAAVVGLDGIPVEKVSIDEDLNIDLQAAEGIGVVKRAASTLQDLEEDPLEEVTIARQSGLLILRALGPDYFLCFLVDREAIPGRARFEAWRAGSQLRETLA